MKVTRHRKSFYKFFCWYNFFVAGVKYFTADIASHSKWCLNCLAKTENALALKKVASARPEDGYYKLLRPPKNLKSEMLVKDVSEHSRRWSSSLLVQIRITWNCLWYVLEYLLLMMLRYQCYLSKRKVKDWQKHSKVRESTAKQHCSMFHEKLIFFHVFFSWSLSSNLLSLLITFKFIKIKS